MKTKPLKYDEDLQKAFEIIISSSDMLPVVHDIASLVHDNELNSININTILTYHGISKIEDIKSYMLDMVLDYIEIVLENHCITKNEEHNVEFMKMSFRIKEGDFYSMKYVRINSMLEKQLGYLYRDGVITKEEEVYKVDLQAFFDLSCDQFYEIKSKFYSSL